VKADLGAKQRRIIAWFQRSVWSIVLGVVLSISGYSFYVIARHFAVPPLIAIGMSTVYDGSAMLAASYAVKYAEKGLSGTVPRMAVRIFAGTAAYLQTFHARMTHQPNGAWVLWASLPVIAAILYEIHLRFVKREALIAGGSTYASPAPAFGTLSWCIYPRDTYDALKQVVVRRKDAILQHALRRTEVIAAVEPVRRPQLTVINPQDRTRGIAPSKRSDGRKPRKDAPRINERLWLQSNGYKVGDFGRIPEDMHLAYLSSGISDSASTAAPGM
jgi:hypothetical protein